MTGPQPQGARRRRVPAWLGRVVVCLLLGAVTTWGVCWGVSLSDASRRPSSQPSPSDFAWRDPASQKWVLISRDRLGPARQRLGWMFAHEDLVQEGDWAFECVQGRRTRAIWRVSSAKPFGIDTSRRPIHSPYCQVICTSGWPLQAMYHREERIGSCFGFVPPLSSPKVGITLKSAPQLEPRVLPLGIRPLGFAADTVLYANIWHCLIFFPALLRAALRRRRGLCAACAYDLTGIAPGAPCPECGTPREATQAPVAASAAQEAPA